MKTLIAALLVITSGLFGCMSVPVSAEQAEPISSQWVYGGQQTPTSDKSVEVIVVRDKGGSVFGMTGGIMVYCDGERLVNLEDPGTKYTFYVAPGPHSIQVVYVNPSKYEVPGATGGFSFMAVQDKTVKLATGVSVGANEPIRIFQVGG